MYDFCAVITPLARKERTKGGREILENEDVQW
jgi:hypothetical protein